MAVTADKAAPYCPPSAVIEIIERYRSRGLPLPVTGEVLGRAGISDSLIPRTLQALQTLDLINEEGNPTTIFEGIRKAPEAEYRTRLLEWLNGAYADAIVFIDPATADETAVRDAFRNYVPIGQQARMVTLFMGLYAAAGVRPEKERESKPRASPTLVRARANPVRFPAAVKAKLNKSKGGTQIDYSGLHPMLAALLADLPPPNGSWTKAKRDKVVAMFPTVLDFAFTIGEPDQEGEGEDE